MSAVFRGIGTTAVSEASARAFISLAAPAPHSRPKSIRSARPLSLSCAGSRRQRRWSCCSGGGLACVVVGRCGVCGRPGLSRLRDPRFGGGRDGGWAFPGAGRWAARLLALQACHLQAAAATRRLGTGRRVSREEGCAHAPAELAEPARLVAEVAKTWSCASSLRASARQARVAAQPLGGLVVVGAIGVAGGARLGRPRRAPSAMLVALPAKVPGSAALIESANGYVQARERTA